MKILSSLVWAFCISTYVYCSDSTGIKHVKQFNHIIKLKTATVKNQYKSNTCWAYASLALIESELLREKNLDIDLSEMYIVRMAYIEKARRFVRMQGKASFSNGGSLPDAFYIIQKYGILPVSAYRGIPFNLKYPDHIAFDSALKVYMDSVVNSGKYFTNNWEKGFVEILDEQMGQVPDKFIWDNKTFTPKEFAQMINISSSDYLFISSLKVNPYYVESVPEFPDNWLWSKAFNIPWLDMEKTILYGLKEGYTCGLCCDISETGFIFKNGVAEFPGNINMNIIDSLRQIEIDEFRTTDEHAMLTCGLAEDSMKNEYIIFKNSWGEKITPYRDLVYMSFPYLRMKTISILINKKAVPQTILDKLKFCK